MNKKLSIVLIILLSLLIIGTSTLLVIGINKDFNFKSFSLISSRSTNLIDEKEISTIKDIDITSNVVDVEVKEDDIDIIKIELYSNNPDDYRIEDNEKIKVVLEEKNNWFSFGRKNGYIKITLPKTYSKNISSNGKVGDVIIGNIPDATLNIVATTGDVRVKEAKKANIKITTGDIKIDNINTLVSTTTTGDVEVENVDSINTTTKTGDIEINTISSDLKLQSNTGDIEIDSVTIDKNSSIKSNVGDVKVKNTKGCYVEAKTKVGDINVNNPDRKSDIILKIDSRVGDIKVNY